MPNPLSYSRINNFTKCKRMYKFQYIDNLPYPETGPLRIGSAVHRFMENYGKHCIGIMRSQDVEYADKESKRIAGSMPPDEAEQFSEIVDRAIAMHKFSPSLIEERFSLDREWHATKWESAWLRGVIDIHKEENGVVDVTDYKTDRKIQAFTDVEKDLQLKIYVLALSEMYPECKTFNAYKDFLRYGVVVGPVVYKKPQLDDFRVYIGGLIKSIEDEKEFLPNVGSACDWCPYFRKCEAYKREDPDFRERLDDERAVRLAEWVYRTEKKTKEARDKLRAFVDEQQRNIDFGDMMLGYTESEERNIISSEDLVTELIKCGVQKAVIWEYLKFSRTSMEKVLKKSGKKHLVDDLTNKHFTVSTETKFGFKKRIDGSEE